MIRFRGVCFTNKTWLRIGLAVLLCLGISGCAPTTGGGQQPGPDLPTVTTQGLSPESGSGAAQGQLTSSPAGKPPASAQGQPAAAPQGQSAAPSQGSPTASPAPVTVTTRKVQQNSETIQVDLSIPVIDGLRDGNLQERLNNRFEQDALNFKSEIETQAAEDAKEQAKAGYPFRQYNATTAYKVAFNQNGLLSITVDYYQYTGGAHGATERRPYNFDLAAGQDLSLQDLFREGINYKEAINREIDRQIAANPDGGYYTQPGMGFKAIGDDQPFYLTDGGLVVYFGQYEIAPYAAGIPEFQIPFSLFKSGVRARFLTK